MATIFDLSKRQLLRLQSLDPILDTDYQEVLMDIFGVLDNASKSILLRYNLNPKSIFYDTGNNAFHYSPPLPFHSTISNKKIVHEGLITTLQKMQTFLATINLDAKADLDVIILDARTFCETLENLLNQFYCYKTELPERDYKELLVAFLYEFLGYLPHLDLTIAQNRRGLTGNVIKLFLKEVFIKQALHGINFNVWDDEDDDVLDTGQMPEELRHEIKNRKLAVVETESFWFLIAPPTNGDFKNRYSVCRFLSEDMEFGLYMTYGLCIPKNIYKNKKALNLFLQLFASIYTLEMSVSLAIINFCNEIKQTYHECLSPLLRMPLGETDTVLIEDRVKTRLDEYERKLTDLILSKVPTAIRASNNRDDQFVFTYQLDKVLNQVWWDLEAFTLLPVTNMSDDARLLANRLLSYRLLINKAQTLLWERKDWQVRADTMLKPQKALYQLASDAIEKTEHFQELAESIDHYQENLEEGKIFAKLGFGRPNYTLDDLREAHQTLIDTTFAKILECTSTHEDTLIYFEAENPASYIHDDEYRHYAICHSKCAMDKLPYIIRLPKSKRRFKLDDFYDQIKKTLHNTQYIP